MATSIQETLKKKFLNILTQILIKKNQKYRQNEKDSNKKGCHIKSDQINQIAPRNRSQHGTQRPNRAEHTRDNTVSAQVIRWISSLASDFHQLRINGNNEAPESEAEQKECTYEDPEIEGQLEVGHWSNETEGDC